MNEKDKLENISLRDWFAGQALAGILSRTPESFSYVAKYAYLYADEMIKARSNDEQSR
jgi:hypothetical protein